MPELPEVETIVSDLRPVLLGLKVKSIWLDVPKLLKKPSLKSFELEIKDKIILGIERKGKNILIFLSDDYLLLIHQKMTGHLLFGHWEFKKGFWVAKDSEVLKEKVNNYIHFVLNLSNGYQLALSDLRKFGKIVFGKQEEIFNSEDFKKIGPDLINEKISFDDFKNRITRKNGKVKNLLLDQTIVAGIGNIYADEILWETKINPFRNIKDLNDKELKDVFLATKKILKKAIRLRGSSVSDYRDAFGKPGGYAKERLAYKRENMPCFRCGKKIIRKKISGRSAYYCDFCQK